MNRPILKDFTRWQWAGLTERAWFKPQFERATNAFLNIERWSVVDGLRTAALQYVSWRDIPMMTTWAHQHGLMMIPLHAASTGHGYSASGSTGTPNAIRVLYVRPENYQHALPLDTDDRIGELLGFPACCRQAFADTWGNRQVDSTYEQFDTTGIFNPLNSTLLRWMGIRLVSHMPCSFSCTASADIANQNADVGIRHGHAEEIQFIASVLHWPVYWNRLFGIAEIATPALKITTRSDWTPEKQEFFHTTGTSYQAPQETWWADNGFTDPEAMRQSHELLLSSITDHIPHKSRVMDLGCGNGMLMTKLKRRRPDVKVGGIDIHKDAIARCPMLLGKWMEGRIQDGAWQTSFESDVVLLNPARLLEMTPEEALRTCMQLGYVRTVILYTYSDWAAKMPLEELAQKAGFKQIRMLAKTPELSVAIC